MTLQQCKDKVAKDHGYKHWDRIDWYAENSILAAEGIDGNAEDILIEKAAELYRQSANEWISVEERLPEKFKMVILYGSKGHYGLGCVDASGQIDDYSLHEGEKATHWQPLPEPPKI